MNTTINVVKVYVNDTDRNGNKLSYQGKSYKKVTVVDEHDKKHYSEDLYDPNDMTLQIAPGDEITVESWQNKRGYNIFKLLGAPQRAETVSVSPAKQEDDSDHRTIVEAALESTLGQLVKLNEKADETLDALSRIERAMLTKALENE